MWSATSDNRGCRIAKGEMYWLWAYSDCRHLWCRPFKGGSHLSGWVLRESANIPTAPLVPTLNDVALAAPMSCPLRLSNF